MCGQPIGNLRLGRRFTEEEKTNPSFIREVEHIPFCGTDHSTFIRFGGCCEECGKSWSLIDCRE